MRQGLSPQDACESVCQRVMDRHNGKPMFNLKFVALDKQGRYGCGALRRTGFAVHDARGHRVEDGRALLPRLTQAEIDSLPWR